MACRFGKACGFLDHRDSDQANHGHSIQQGLQLQSIRKGSQRPVRFAGLAVSGAVNAEGRAYLWGFNENSQLAKVQILVASVVFPARRGVQWVILLPRCASFLCRGATLMSGSRV